MSIAILHIFLDEKFFDSVSNFFDTLENIENYYYYYNKGNIPFKYIKQTDKIKFFYSEKEYIEAISLKKVDIVYLHSLSPSFYKYILSQSGW